MRIRRAVTGLLWVLLLFVLQCTACQGGCQLDLGGGSYLPEAHDAATGDADANR